MNSGDVALVLVGILYLMGLILMFHETSFQWGKRAARRELEREKKDN